MTGKEWNLCLHGHFYQPPRENPWLEQIELQESAAPFHDWNERIYYECYLPNAIARVLDSKGEIVGIINNFEGISFNIGPTLMSWLEEKHPETYQQIIAADYRSRELRSGHGNAISQVYNHMILPLANRRDKLTQVRWGIQDFRYRFGRDPDAMWLPETACNDESLEILAEEGIKFTILAPHQAEAIRPIPESGLAAEAKDGWQDVSSGQIDPRQPYRYFLRKDPTKSIDIFFY
ncbi:MAG: glycoside hydrolase, partial [Candidatus Omnitrophica bacterium]|nr:glycoside hydrolase [Candidatus Omnitrophota bacterium]